MLKNPGRSEQVAGCVAGLVDEYNLFTVTVIVGGGLPYFPDGARADLELVHRHRFGDGALHLRYQPRS